METFALFDDGSVSRIIFGFLPPDPDGSPVQLHPIDIPDRDVRSSATNGCYAAYQALLQLGVIQAGEKYALSYQFDGGNQGVNTMGKSAGLAFCLKFAQEIYQKNRGESLGFSIAATGEISHSGPGATVKPVGGLNAKLEGAERELQLSDHLFLPGTEITDHADLIAAADWDQMRPLHPVKTVREAIQILFDQSTLCPIQIKGVRCSGNGAYQVSPWCLVGIQCDLSFTVVNIGNCPVHIKLKEELKLGWIILSLDALTLNGGDEQTIKMTIHPRTRLSFVNWKLWRREPLQVSLACHVSSASPAAPFRLVMDVNCCVVNPWPLAPVISIGLVLWLLTASPCSMLPPWAHALVNRIACAIRQPDSDIPTRLRAVKNRLEGGDYLEAKTQLDQLFQCDTGVAEVAQSLSQQMTTPLNPSIDFRHMGSLGSGDGYKLSVTPRDPAFFYIIQVDSNGNLEQLFPNPDISAVSNPLKAQQHYQFPDDENWFILDDQVGQETLYFVATRWPSRDLDDLFSQRYRVSSPVGQEEPHDPILKRFKARDQARKCGVGGVFFKSYTFQHP